MGHGGGSISDRKYCGNGDIEDCGGSHSKHYGGINCDGILVVVVVIVRTVIGGGS